MKNVTSAQEHKSSDVKHLARCIVNNVNARKG